MGQRVKAKLIASVKSTPNAAGRWKFAVHIYDSIKFMSTGWRGEFSKCHMHPRLFFITFCHIAVANWRTLHGFDWHRVQSEEQAKDSDEINK